MQNGLVLSVGPLEGDTVPCELETIDEISARIRIERGFGLPEMSSVALWLSEAQSGSAVVLPAYTGWPEDDGDDLVCDLYFAQPNALHEYVEGEAMDRRTAVRVVPAPDEVEIWLTSDRPGSEDPVECIPVDLGEGGVCLELTVGLEPTEPFTTAQVQVLLPGAAWPLLLRAQVRHRTRVSREIVRFGLEFDEGRTIAFPDQRRAISGYVQGVIAQVAERVRPAQ